MQSEYLSAKHIHKSEQQLLSRIFPASLMRTGLNFINCSKKFAGFSQRKVTKILQLFAVHPKLHKDLLSAEKVAGEVIHLHKVTRSEMGSYMCIAKNGVPPAVSKTVQLNVNCK